MQNNYILSLSNLTKDLFKSTINDNNTFNLNRRHIMSKLSDDAVTKSNGSHLEISSRIPVVMCGNRARLLAIRRINISLSRLFPLIGPQDLLALTLSMYILLDKIWDEVMGKNNAKMTL